MQLMLLLVFTTAQAEAVLLPRWMTPEESLRVDEIGAHHVITAAPGGLVETPSEYEPMRGVFITWIYSDYSVRPIFREIVREVVEVGKAYVIASAGDTTSIKNYLINGGVPLTNVVFYVFPYNSIWMRDYGPWFMRKQDGTEGIVDLQYNRPRPADDTIPRSISHRWGIPYYGSPLEHPGGNFMVDGIGTGWFSSLIYEENPGYNEEEVDSLMLAYHGLDQTVPVTRILTEYTGHIDLWTKTLNDTLVMVGEYEPGHFNDTVLDNRADSIANCVNREGFPYRVVRMPMPWSTSDAPPSYLNSLFINNKVLVPLWDEPEDDTALLVYQEHLPDYEVIGIDCSAMSNSGGAIHCITMQIPSPEFVHIRHAPLSDTADTLNAYRVRASVISSSSLETDSALVYYRIGATGGFSTVPLTIVPDTQSIYAGYIPAQSAGDTVYYYILARNTQGIRRTSPAYVPPQLYRFVITGGVAVAEGGACPVTSFVLSPNPTRGRIALVMTASRSGPAVVSIYNAAGQRVLAETQNLAHGVNRLELSAGGLPSGAYFVQIAAGGRAFHGKFLLTR